MKCIASGHVYEMKTVIVDNEHKAYSIVCPMMQMLIKAELSSEVKSSQQYGSSIKGLVVQTWTQGIASVSRTAKMVKKFLGKAISEGTVMTILKDFEDKCLSLIPVVRNYLSSSPVKNADETGMRVNGMLQWLHTVCNDKATYLYANKKEALML